MKTLLRNIPTGLYFQDLEHWTANPKQAFDFRIMSRALRFVQKARFPEMELVLVLDRRRHAH
jgi:hypothetical protein